MRTHQIGVKGNIVTKWQDDVVSLNFRFFTGNFRCFGDINESMDSWFESPSTNMFLIIFVVYGKKNPIFSKAYYLISNHRLIIISLLDWTDNKIYCHG